MKELELLKSMWSPKIRRKTTLIVPEVTFSELIGSLNNEHWVYKVPYAFRDALDIKYEQRKKDKKPYMVWTQGPVLRFKEGDSFTRRDEKKALHIETANQMGWDSSLNEMFEGSVVYDEFDINDGEYRKINHNTCTQMQFLQLLISG